MANSLKKSSFMLITALLIMFVGSTSAYAATAAQNAGNEDEALHEISVGVERHLVEIDGIPYFDETSAAQTGESEDVIRAGNYLNDLIDAVLIYENQQQEPNYRTPVSMQRLSFPVWGNWCGPLHSGPGAPIDTLDRLCMRHDKCYEQRGYFDCACDAQLKAEIDRYSSRMAAKERSMAAAIKTFFSIFPCKPV